jgi:magnesium-transporting ATPase (P-type)
MPTKKQKTKKKPETKLLRKGMKAPFKPTQGKYSKRDIFALIFALVSVSFLILCSITFLSNKASIPNMMKQDSTIDPSLIASLPGYIVFISLFWLFFAIILAFITYKIEKKQYKWYVLLIFSALCMNFISFILGLVASILYIKNHR